MEKKNEVDKEQKYCVEQCGFFELPHHMPFKTPTIILRYENIFIDIFFF